MCEEDGTPNSTVNLASRQATILLDPDETVTCTFLNTVAAPPEGEPTDVVGVGKDQYRIAQTVYATGSGFIPSANVDVYIVRDRKWTDGTAIPPDVSSDGANILPTNLAGNLGPAMVWPPPLVPGDYDAVFDANQNGVYDEATDLVDDPNHPGFVVIGDHVPVGGIAVPVNRLGLVAPWLALVALILVGALLLPRSRKPR